MSISRDAIVSILCSDFIDKPDLFSYERPDCIKHIKSGVFYDPENYAVGYWFLKNESDKSSEEFRMVEMPEDDVLKIHEACRKWLDWYEDNRYSELMNRMVDLEDDNNL